MSFDPAVGATFLYYFLGLFIIINPLSTAIIFITLTEDVPEREKNRTAVGAAVTSTVILTMFALGGVYIFNFFGISIGAFQITGGIVLISVGLRLLKGEGKRLHSSHFEAEEIMVVPLAIPMLAGAGAITTVIVYVTEGVSLVEMSLLLFAIAANGLCAYAILRYSFVINKIFKERGLRVLNRIMGLIVLSMAVEFILHGLAGAGVI